MQYPRLFTPIQIGSMTLKNRIVMPAMHHLYTENGYATPRFNEYYWKRVEGGAGLIIVGSCRFDGYGAKANSMSLAEDSTIPGWQEFTRGVHRPGRQGCGAALPCGPVYAQGGRALRKRCPLPLCHLRFLHPGNRSGDVPSADF